MTGKAPAVLAEARRVVDDRLNELAASVETEVGGTLGEALGYALRSPGKRVRPAILMAAYRASGGNDPGASLLATAVEVVHTYSLVHDDLPCMDNDELRRGRATTHVAFDVETATRVGFLLVPTAAEELARAAERLDLSAVMLGRLGTELFEAGGIRGMVGGQWLDLEAEGQAVDLDGLLNVHGGKTGALICSSAVIGAIAAGADAATVAAMRIYGNEIGIAFQIADDVLDATGTSRELGKTAGKDAEHAKSTYVGLLGVDGAAAEARRHSEAAIAALRSASIPDQELGPLARYIVQRTN